MKFTTYIVPALAALASAGKVDECAGSCISKAIGSTGCASSDSMCICASDSFMQTIESCATCSEGGKDAAVKLAEDYCDGIGHAHELQRRQFDGEYHGHPMERWFAEHPEYLQNHPGWLNRHPEWALAHQDFIKGQIGHTWKPQPTSPPHHPSPPKYPHRPSPPTTTTPPHGYPTHPHPPHYPTQTVLPYGYGH